MKFNFIREDGQTEEIHVSCFIGRYESEADHLNSLLKAEVQPISFAATQRIFDACKVHAQQQYEYGRNITMDAPNSSTACAYRRMMREGLRGDEDFDAINRVMERLKQPGLGAAVTPPSQHSPIFTTNTRGVCEQTKRPRFSHHATPGSTFSLFGTRVLSRPQSDSEISAAIAHAMQAVGSEGVVSIDTCDFRFHDDAAEARAFISLEKIAHAGITRMALDKEVKVLTSEVGFNPSIYLRVTSELTPETITRDKFYTLIALGANPNTQDHFGRTCLHLILDRLNPKSLSTVKNEHRIALLNWLIDVGANLDLADEKGITPRTLAAQKHGLSFDNGIFSIPSHQNRFYRVPATEPSNLQGPPPPAPLD